MMYDTYVHIGYFNFSFSLPILFDSTIHLEHHNFYKTLLLMILLSLLANGTIIKQVATVEPL